MSTTIGVGGEPRRAVVVGLLTGAAIAVGFALVISLFPESWFTQTLQRGVLYAVQVLAAPLFVVVTRAIAQATSTPGRSVLLWAVVGALAIDGLLLGFWPGIYGHSGEALTWVASTLLWAFAWIIAAALLLTPATPGHAKTSTSRE